MPKIFILYGTSLFLALAGILLIRNGLKKKDFKSTMELIHYRPIRNYGKGFSIALGVLCLILGIILLTMKPK
jgi:uncharacterized membrane protein HdeD (DUF308 family)